jgi:hypothetical protein
MVNMSGKTKKSQTVKKEQRKRKWVKRKLDLTKNGNSIPVPISATITNGTQTITRRGRGKEQHEKRANLGPQNIIKGAPPAKRYFY